MILSGHNSSNLVWLRLDLRLTDNPALAAAERGGAVIPVFIHAPEEESPWLPGGASCWWLHQSLRELDARLLERGSRLVIRRGPALATLRALVKETGATASSATVNSGQWTHVAVTYDGATYRLYINVVADGATAFGGANGEGLWSFTVGQSLNTNYPGTSFNGTICGVAFWSRDLTADQISQIVSNGVPGQPLLSGSIVAGQLSLSWVGAGFVLQQNDTLAKSAAWTDVPGGGSPLALPITSSARFYRLRAQ